MEPTHADEIASMKEGIGTAYEYFVKRRYIINLIRSQGLRRARARTDITRASIDRGF
jgi:hypothetical protein